jgi:hypothetical protein
MQESRVEPKFELAARIAAQSPIVVEIALTQWQVEAAPPSFRQKR